MKRARKRRIGKYSLDSMALDIFFHNFLQIFNFYALSILFLYFSIFFFLYRFKRTKKYSFFFFFFLVINKPITREAKIINNRNLRKKMKLDPLKMDLK